ncbi:unnamed protein product [Adineta ricciae]|uniref:Uncharacterized protein n=1 Tax=Adineta ricciae TaxID=249248 RepID=A0A814M9X5_ADIRI|nr:unnamed protein product [Adineta ricciae]
MTCLLGLHEIERKVQNTSDRCVVQSYSIIKTWFRYQKRDFRFCSTFLLSACSTYQVVLVGCRHVAMPNEDLDPFGR